jgi:DNA-binding MarR family transcriptional regulator
MPRAVRRDGLFEPNLFLQFFLAGQPLGRLVERAIASSEMTTSEYALLSAVDELEPVMPSDVARLTGIPRPTLTALTGRLAAGGLIERIPNPRDGRSYFLSLSARGRATKDANGRALASALAALEIRLEGRADELAAALGVLRLAAESALEEEPAERVPPTRRDSAG